MLILTVVKLSLYSLSLKYYQQSIASLTATFTDQEKMSVKKIIEQFLNSHDYFSEI